jgi:hypothetical protein
VAVATPAAWVALAWLVLLARLVLARLVLARLVLARWCWQATAAGYGGGAHQGQCGGGQRGSLPVTFGHG